MKKYLFWIAELFIWLLILFLVSGGIMLAKYNYKRQLNTYQMFLPDVDGLINGSPVRMMGMQIGYVNQVDIVGEDVYVKFIVTDKDVAIPNGSVATVEFTGLGGSKSLEIYPPEPGKVKFTKLLVPQSPKRIHDSLGLLNDMFEQITSIAYDVSHFMGQIGIIKQKNEISSPTNGKSAVEILDSSNSWIDEMQKKLDNFDSKKQSPNQKNLTPQNLNSIKTEKCIKNSANEDKTNE